MPKSRRLGYNDIVIYLVYSEESELARRSALKILKKEFPERDEFNYISLNMAVSPLKDLADECSYLPLGVDRKAVFAEDCQFLAKPARAKGTGKTGPKKKTQKMDVSMERLAAYCQNPNDFIDLYLVVYSGALDENNPVVQAVKNTGRVLGVQVPSPQEWVDFALRFLKKYGVETERNVAEEIVRRVNGDYGRFLSDLAKLSIYANGEPLSMNAVKRLVSPKLEDDAFTISNALMRNDVPSAIAIYHDLKVFGVDEIRLMNLLANQFRFMDMVQTLSDMGLGSDAIAAELAAKPFRVSVTLRNLQGSKKGSLPRVIDSLYVTEKAILSGEQPPRLAFERFLATFLL